MNELQIFNNPEFGDIRIVEINGEPWFVGKDIAEALGYANPSKAIIDHVDEEDKRFEMLPVTDSQNGKPFKTAIINQSGVYSLIFSSKLEKAREFKHWVTSEVLPAINKHGAYLTPAAAAQLTAALQTQTELTVTVQKLAERVEALEDAATTPFAPAPSQSPALPAPPPWELPLQPPEKAALRRWTRIASEKLDLLSARFRKSNNELLSSLYRYLEQAYDEDLTELRLRVIEEYGLDDCSTMKAIFFSETLKAAFEQNIDNNLAPENRGW